MSKLIGGLALALCLVTTVSAGEWVKQWGFNPETGQGGVNKSDVERALGLRGLGKEQAQGLRFSAVDTVDGGCVRERPLNMYVRTGGNESQVTGFWFFGYESQDSFCGSGLLGGGGDAKLHVNGVPIE